MWVSSSEVDEPRDCYTEWSKSERGKQISYVNAYTWNPEKWYWWIYSQSRNRNTAVENRLVDTVKGGEVGTRWDSSSETYESPYVEQTAARGAAIRHRELSLVLCDSLERQDAVGGGREVQEGGCICMLVTDSRCCMSETNTTL